MLFISQNSGYTLPLIDQNHRTGFNRFRVFTFCSYYVIYLFIGIRQDALCGLDDRHPYAVARDILRALNPVEDTVVQTG